MRYTSRPKKTGILMPVLYVSIAFFFFVQFPICSMGQSTAPSLNLYVVNNCGYSDISAKDDQGIEIAAAELEWSNGFTGNPVRVTSADAITATRTVEGVSASNTILPAPRFKPQPPLVTVENLCYYSILTAKDAEGKLIPAAELEWKTGNYKYVGNPINNGNNDPFQVYRRMEPGGCASEPTYAKGEKLVPPAPVLSITGSCNNQVLASDSMGIPIPANEVIWLIGDKYGSGENPITVGGSDPVKGMWLLSSISSCNSGYSDPVFPAPAEDVTMNATVYNYCGSSQIVIRDQNFNIVEASELTWSNGMTGNPIRVTSSEVITVTRNLRECQSVRTVAAAPRPAIEPPVIRVTNHCGSAELAAYDPDGDLISPDHLYWNYGTLSGNPVTVTKSTWAGAQRVDGTGCVSAPSTAVWVAVATTDTPDVSVINMCGSSILSTSAPGSLLWGTGETSNTITVTDAGPYTLTQTIDGCTSTPAVVSANPKPKPPTPVGEVVASCYYSTLIAKDQEGNTLPTDEVQWRMFPYTYERNPQIVYDDGTYTLRRMIDGCYSDPVTVVAKKLKSGIPSIQVDNRCGSSVLTAVDADGNAIDASEVRWLIGGFGRNGNPITVEENTPVQAEWYLPEVNSCNSGWSEPVTPAPKTPVAAPEVTVVNNCNGTSTLSIIEGGTILWSTGETGTSIVVNAAGQYSVTRTIDGCTSEPGYAEATPYSTPVANLPDVYAFDGGAANTIYNGFGPNSITIYAEVTGGTEPYSYKWTIGSPVGQGMSNDNNFTVSPSTTTTYVFNVKDANGCAVTFLTKTIEVVDVRCGPRMDKVAVCKSVKGNYSTSCIAEKDVLSALRNGARLGSCTTDASNKKMGSFVWDVKLNLLAAPNPTQHAFNIQVTSDNTRDAIQLRVVDILGRVVEMKNNVVPNSSVPLGAAYKQGVYMIEVMQGDQRRQLKVIKQ